MRSWREQINLPYNQLTEDEKAHNRDLHEYAEDVHAAHAKDASDTQQHNNDRLPGDEEE